MHVIASTVVIVVSDNLMSMYAANNIARAVRHYSRNGVHLAGLVANDVRDPARVAELASFAERLGTRLLAEIPHDPRFRAAERERALVTDLHPDSDLSRTFEAVAAALRDLDEAAAPS